MVPGRRYLRPPQMPSWTFKQSKGSSIRLGGKKVEGGKRVFRKVVEEPLHKQRAGYFTNPSSEKGKKLHPGGVDTLGTGLSKSIKKKTSKQNRGGRRMGKGRLPIVFFKSIPQEESRRLGSL